MRLKSIGGDNMSDYEKIMREYQMLLKDLQLARESALLRIIRNKRHPPSARYAAIIIYENRSPDSPGAISDNSSDESMIAEINEFLHEIDRP